MKQTGAGLILLGLIISFIALTLDTTVSSAATYIGGQFTGGGSTHNLGLMQQQMMIFQGGLALLLAGAVLYGSGAVVEAAESPREAPRTWDDIQADETEEERDERVRLARRRDVTALIVSALVIIAAISVAVISNYSEPPRSPIMNVDENLTTDMDAVDMNATMDMNAQ